MQPLGRSRLFDIGEGKPAWPVPVKQRARYDQAGRGQGGDGGSQANVNTPASDQLAPASSPCPLSILKANCAMVPRLF